MALAFFGVGPSGNPPLSASIPAGNIVFNNFNPNYPIDVSRTVSVSGGTGNYTYSWTDNTFAQLINSTSATVTVRFNSDGEYLGTLSCTVNDGETVAGASVDIFVQLGIPE